MVIELGNTYTARKVFKYGVISGPYFPAFGLNTERYEASVCIQSEYGKIRTRNNSVFGHFSRSDTHNNNFKLVTFRAFAILIEWIYQILFFCKRLLFVEWKYVSSRSLEKLQKVLSF